MTDKDGKRILAEINDDYAQLSPLLDQAVQFIEHSGRLPSQQAGLCALALLRFSLGTQLAILRAGQADDEIDNEIAERIAELLEASTREADETIKAELERRAAVIQ